VCCQAALGIWTSGWWWRSSGRDGWRAMTRRRRRLASRRLLLRRCGGHGGVGVGMGGRADRHDGGQGPVGLAVAAAVEPLADHLPGGGGDGWCRGVIAPARVVSSACGWLASAAKNWMRWALARRACTVAWCSGDLVGRVRGLARCWSWLVVWGRRAWLLAPGERRRSAPRAGRWRPPSGGRAGRVLTSARGASRSPRRRGMAGRCWPAPRGRLGRRPARRCWRRCDWLAAWSAHLQDPLAALGRRHRQASAEATRSLDRPQAMANNLTVSKVEQLLVARGVGTGGGWVRTPAEVGDGGRGQVARWVSTPTGAVDGRCQHGHCGRPPWTGRPWSASAGRRHRAAGP
jgi:hypothetical protein